MKNNSRCSCDQEGAGVKVINLPPELILCESFSWSKSCRISTMDNNTRQVFHTQGFEYPQRPAVLTAAINEKTRI